MTVRLSSFCLAIYQRYCKLKYYYWFSCCELRKWFYRQVVFLNRVIFSFLALAVYSRCPSAYEALSNLNILQLPCSKVLKRVLKEGSEKPGVVEDYMRQQLEEFRLWVQEAAWSRWFPITFRSWHFNVGWSKGWSDKSHNYFIVKFLTANFTLCATLYIKQRLITRLWPWLLLCVCKFE